MAEQPQLLEEQRENWGGRAAFVLAAVGSAVGLGNLWGFPYKVYAYGGGAFLIPYLLAMLAVGIPLMILEFSLGHMTQRAAPDAYRGINRKSEPVGWWGILLGFVIITYYPVILAWCGDFLVQCLKTIFTGEPLPWAGEGLEGVAKAKDYFHHTYLNRWPDHYAGNAWEFGRLVGPIVASLAVIWVLMYLCIFRGVRLVGKVVMWTVPLPWIMLLILTIRGLTLPGAAEGLNFYLSPDWSKLAEPETWRWGFGQMFFSMSLAFGVMITYASFLHRKSDLNNNAAIIGLADVATSFVAGLAVFATLGGMAFATQVAAAEAANPDLAVPVENVAQESVGLAFVAFPYALAQLPAAPYFGAVFFLALLLLGIDSAFSITESVLASLVDKTGWSRGRTLIGLSVVGFGAGLVYCTRGGLNWLGAIDGFINDTSGGIILIGLLEFLVIGWGYRLGRLRRHANERSDWNLGRWWEWIVRYIAPQALSVLFVWSLLHRTSKGGGFLFNPQGALQVPTLVGLIIAVLAPIVSLVLSLIRSPGANAHAAHVGQPRLGRGAGVVGTLLVLGALLGVGWSFRSAWTANHTGNRYVFEAQQAAEKAGTPPGPPPVQAVADLSQRAILPLVLAGVLAAGALVLGASVVYRGETRDGRPSGFGRWAAAWGVLLLGAAGGVGLSVGVLPHSMAAGKAKAETTAAETQAKLAAEAAEVARDKAAPAAAEAAAERPKTAAAAKAPGAPQPAELESMSYVVLTVMLAILVIGLAWCFYRAVRAAGGTDMEQTPEDGDAA